MARLLFNKDIFKSDVVRLCFVSFTILFNISCKKLVDVNSPTTNITGKNVFTNDATAAAVLTQIYVRISSNSLGSGDMSSIGYLTGLSGDELSLKITANTDLNKYYLNNLDANSVTDIWRNNYPKLFAINSAIEKVPTSESLSQGLKKQLLGEAKFMRAFIYFYLVNLYGDVPLVTSTDYKINSALSRTPKDKVWGQIISDLKDAKDLLSPIYVDGNLINPTPERVRPNKWAAVALLARSYMYIHDWANAEASATEIINNTSLYHIDSLDNVFQKNNWEAIWQLQPVNYGSNTEDARVYIIRSTGFSYSKPAYLSSQLINSFESNDRRKQRWIDTITLSSQTYYFASKYKSDSLNAPVTEYNTIFRLGEQYLIRAEARAQQNKIKNSLDDINLIRERAWLSKLQINMKDSLLTAIYHERQVELFTEWGHRWLDMKRLQQVNSIMQIVTPQKGGTWSSNWQLYPIPSSDIISDVNLIQNEGY